MNKQNFVQKKEQQKGNLKLGHGACDYYVPSKFKCHSYLQIQRESWAHFLNQGLVKEFACRNFSYVLPDTNNQISVRFYPEHYRLYRPKIGLKACILERKTYESSLYLPVVFQYNLKQSFFRWVKVAHLPLLTCHGHFILNGTPRIVINQVLRSPGVYYRASKKKSSIVTADFIAWRGAWLRLECDTEKKGIWVKLKKMPKIPIVLFLMCMGLPMKWAYLYMPLFENLQYIRSENQNVFSLREEVKQKELFALQQRTFDFWHTNNLKKNLNPSKRMDLFVTLALEVYGTSTRFEDESEKPDALTLFKVENTSGIMALPMEDLRRFFLALIAIGEHDIVNDMKRSLIHSQKVKQSFLGKFFNPKNYSLSVAGRMKLNQTLGLSIDKTITQLTPIDILFGCFYLLECLQDNKPFSDIDALENRIVSPLGVQLQNQLAVGLNKLDRHMQKKIPSDHEWKNYFQYFNSDTDITRFINPKKIDDVFKSFLATDPLSQFLDQTNALAELTHKRRVSSMGTGGVDRTNATMDVRGIHPSQYGRICPIETPEGQNAGLVNSFTTHARVTENGQVTTPFYSCYKGMILKEKQPCFYTPGNENVSFIAPGDVERSRLGFLCSGKSSPLVPCRQKKDFQRLKRTKIDLIGVNPIQMTSVATSLIPFLEHDDGNRALMGSNMQRQAVATVIPQKPIVGTGFESKVTLDTENVKKSKSFGFVGYVDSQKIMVYKPGINNSHNNKQTFFLPESYHQKKLSFGFIDHFFQWNRTNAWNFFHLFRNPKINKKKSGQKFFTFLQRFSSLNSSCKYGYYGLFNFRTSTKHLNHLGFPVQKSPERQSTLFDNIKHINVTAFEHKQLSTTITYVTKKKTNKFQKATLSQSKNLCEQNILKMRSFHIIPSSSFFHSEISRKQSTRFDHKLESFFRTNQDTYVLHRPNVKFGDWVEKGDTLADSGSSHQGEFAIGQNLLIGYTPWQGYNFEDAVLLSESMVCHDTLTSIHIERYKVNVKDTIYGWEQLTPNIGPSGRKHPTLDPQGVIKVGSWVNGGDFLVGKMAPINRGMVDPTEALLYDILDLENLGVASVRNTSVVAPDDFCGRVIHVQKVKTETQFFNVAQGTKKSRSDLDFHHKAKVHNKTVIKQVSNRNFSKKQINQNMKQRTHAKKPFSSTSLNAKFQQAMSPKNMKMASNQFKQTQQQKKPFLKRFQKKACNYIYDMPNMFKAKDDFKTESEINSSFSVNSITEIYIYLAVKRKIQVGDKISGRHGNKGIISRILPREDMPYLPDGTPLDLVLNPLGVPSRMNVGQIFECLLGLAGSYLHQCYRIQPFDEIYGCETSRSLVYSKLYEARLRTKQNWLFDPNFPGKIRLFDGRSGQCFEQPVTVGKAYILKLIHMVDEKMHARSTGPYSLITQQPVRGRSRKGGQRLGEMEVWALEGFGAAYILQELLTVKSDDIFGRQFIVESIFDPSQPMPVVGPEAFRVLMLELRALNIDLNFQDDHGRVEFYRPYNFECASFIGGFSEDYDYLIQCWKPCFKDYYFHPYTQ